MSVLLFLLVLFVLVLVHEFGHFVVAKWAKMRVDEFGIGFPPKIFGIKRGETEYTLNLLPLGGFVKIQGEDGVVDAEARTVAVDTLVQKESGLFTEKSKWAQAAVLIAGVTMNVLLAWVLMIVVLTTGVQKAVSESEASEEAQLTIAGVLPGSPAEKASLPSGAYLTEVISGGAALEEFTPTAFSAFIASHSEEPVLIAYTYHNELRMTQIQPEKGIIETNADQPAIGVSLALVDVVTLPFHKALVEASATTIASLRDITLGIASLFYDAIRFRADFSQVAGPVGIVGLVGEASAFGLASLLMFTAFISLNLAVINILPFPALDGGRLLFVAIEAIKGSPINPRIAGTLNMVGFSLLLVLMVAVTWNDIARLL